MVKWPEYEKLVEQIYLELKQGVQVTRNDKIMGVDSQRIRQIDVSIHAKIASHDVLIIVQAKDYSRPADINVVGTFASVVKDVRAQKGVLVCNAGFTKTAKVYARNIGGIDLCSIHDAQSRNWSLDIRLPLLWIDLLPQTQVLLECYLEAGDSIPTDVRQWILSADDEKTRLLPLETFERKWNARELDRTCGKTHVLIPEQRNMKVLVGKGVWRPVDSLVIQYTVGRRAWLGYIAPSECRGILDHIKDEFTPTYFKISDIPMVRDESWQPIEDPEKVAVTTKGMLITTEHWEISLGQARSTFFAQKLE